MQKTFTRTLIQFEILSEEPLGSVSLEDIAYQTTDGHCSGRFHDTVEEQVDFETIRRLLIDQGSDPDFLMELEEDDECPHCRNGTLEIHDNEARCRGECGSIWDLSCKAATRPVEFLLISEKGFWESHITEVPVEIRWNRLQAWADDNLSNKPVYRKALRFIPWNEDPHA